MVRGVGCGGSEQRRPRGCGVARRTHERLEARAIGIGEPFGEIGVERDLRRRE